MPHAAAPPRTFQDLIFALQKYWSERGCIVLQPYDMEMGAGTFHSAATLSINMRRRRPSVPP